MSRLFLNSALRSRNGEQEGSSCRLRRCNDEVVDQIAEPYWIIWANRVAIVRAHTRARTHAIEKKIFVHSRVSVIERGERSADAENKHDPRSSFSFGHPPTHPPTLSILLVSLFRVTRQLGGGGTSEHYIEIAAVPPSRSFQIDRMNSSAQATRF